jgi:hypothetical protein
MWVSSNTGPTNHSSNSTVFFNTRGGVAVLARSTNLENLKSGGICVSIWRWRSPVLPWSGSTKHVNQESSARRYVLYSQFAEVHNSSQGPRVLCQGTVNPNSQTKKTGHWLLFPYIDGVPTMTSRFEPVIWNEFLSCCCCKPDMLGKIKSCFDRSFLFCCCKPGISGEIKTVAHNHINTIGAAK